MQEKCCTDLWWQSNKRNELHNKGCYHKGQYNVTFFCTKGLSIQTNKRMATSASLCEGPIFYLFVFTFMQESKYSSLLLFIFSFCKHHVVRKYLGTYVQLNMSSMSYYCWHHPKVNTLGGEIISPYLSMCPVQNVLLMCMRWVLAIIEDYMMVGYVELLLRLCWISWLQLFGD